jgi:WD40 repeat protein
MDTPENYYATLGVPADADNDTIKRAYRQLARRFHPDLAGPEGAIEMKRINRAYAVLGDEEKRDQYDIILGGVVDLRRKGYTRPRPRTHAPEHLEDVEFSGLNMFSTRGPLHAGPMLKNPTGITSAISSIHTVHGLFIAAGSLDGKGLIWHIVDGHERNVSQFAAAPGFTIESLRALRFSSAGSLLVGWHRLGLHVWDAYSGATLWSIPLHERAVSAHYSLDATLHITPAGQRKIKIALPHLAPDKLSPRALGVRSTDVVSYDITTATDKVLDQHTCPEETTDNKLFWAIRMRALAQDGQTLVTLSCAQVPHEKQEMAIVRRWNLASRGRLGGSKAPQIDASVLVGPCTDCAPPYAITPDVRLVAFVYGGDHIRLCDTTTGVYSEIASGPMGGSSRLAISPDAQWLAVAREDSEVNEGVIDLWSISTGQIIQKFYHPWQISALHFTENKLVVALTDGTLQVWQ